MGGCPRFFVDGKSFMTEYAMRIIKWKSTGDALFPFKSVVEENELAIGINDFPDEPLYSLYVNGKKVSDFNSWPAMWQK